MNDGTPIIIKKKKAAPHAHHGGSWKVAYADFVTAMMAFFMVLWIMGLSDDTRTQIQGYFNDPHGFMKTLQRSTSVVSLPGVPPMTRKDRPNQTIEDQQRVEVVKRQIENELHRDDTNPQSLSQYVDVQVTGEGLRIDFVETLGAVFFENGKAEIRPKARALIKRLAPILTQSHRTVVIEGHTDARPYPGTGYTNWDLSSDRANAMRRLLVQDGVAQHQIVEVSAYADTRLRVPENPNHFSNRRVTLLLPYEKRMVEETLPAETMDEKIHTLAPAKPNIHPDPIR